MLDRLINIKRSPDFIAEIFGTPEEKQTVLVYLEDAGPDGVDAYISTPITINATGIRTDIEVAYKDNGFSERLNYIFNHQNRRV